MVSIGISEFTFGYAFLYEQTRRNWGDLRAAPVLPNLQQEYEEAWDARLPLNGVDYYYQFKLTEVLRRRNAKYIADGTYSGQYFRISLHKHENSRQHRRLKMHADTHRHTYYVAPEIDESADFNSIFLQELVTDNSRIIPLGQCDNIDDNDNEQHYITFQENDINWIQHSEKSRKEHSILGKDIRHLYETSRMETKELDENYSRQLFDDAVSTVWRIIDSEDKEYRRRTEKNLSLLEYQHVNQTRENILKRTSKVLSVFLGLTLVIVGTD